MPAPIPCPNPNCGQLLAVESIQGTGKVACPRCGTVLQFRSPAPVAPPAPSVPPAPTIPLAQPVRPTPPAAQPVRPGPPAPPAPPPVPTANRVPPVPVPPTVPAPPAYVPASALPPTQPLLPTLDEEEDDEEDEEDEEDSRWGANPRLAFHEPSAGDSAGEGSPGRRPGKRPASMARFFIIAPLVMLALSTAIFLIYLAVKFYASNPEYIDSERFIKGIENAYYPVLNAPWGKFKPDEERALKARGRMVVNYAACRSSPSNAFAIYARDYQTRLPTEGEMLDIALQKLRGSRSDSNPGYFSGVEWERLEGDHRIAGVPAIRLEFEGLDSENVECSGEAWVIAANGVGYWFFFWGPRGTREELMPEWEELRGKFSLGTKRPRWTETIPDPTLAKIPETAYEFKYPGGDFWEERREAGWDPEARVVLIAYERDNKNRPPEPNKRYAGKMSVLQVLRLPAVENPDDALKAAKDYLLEQQKAENPATRMDVLTDKDNKPREGKTTIGAVDGFITRLEVIPDPGGRRRFFLLGVVADPQGLLVFQFGCPLDRREYWESEFTAILKTLRRSKT